jgi:hypothetical protein
MESVEVVDVDAGATPIEAGAIPVEAVVSQLHIVYNLALKWPKTLNF